MRARYKLEKGVLPPSQFFSLLKTKRNKVEKEPYVCFSSLWRGSPRGSKPRVHKTALQQFYFTFHYESFAGSLGLEGPQAALAVCREIGTRL